MFKPLPRFVVMPAFLCIRCFLMPAEVKDVIVNVSLTLWLEKIARSEPAAKVKPPLSS